MPAILTNKVDFYYVFQGVFGHALPFSLYARGRLGIVRAGTTFVRNGDVLIPERIEMLDLSGTTPDGTALDSDEMKSWWPQNYWGPYSVSILELKGSTFFRSSMDAPLRPLHEQRYESLPAPPGEQVQLFQLSFEDIMKQLEGNPTLFNGLLGNGVFLRTKSGAFESMKILAKPS